MKKFFFFILFKLLSQTMPPNLGNLYCLFSQNNCIKGTVSVISIVNLYAALAMPDSQHVPFV